MTTKTKTADKAKTTKAVTDEPKATNYDPELSAADKARLAAAEADKQEAMAQDKAGDRDEGDEDVTGVEDEFAPTFVVDITKDPMMKPVLRVYEHEIAILEELHGADNIHVRESTERELPISGSAEAEYARLETRYGRNGLAALRATYPSVMELASASGLSVEGSRRRSRSSRTKDAKQSAQRGKKSD